MKIQLVYVKSSTETSSISNIIQFLAAQGFECPSKEKEQFPDPIQCDKYYDCVNGTATPTLCPDGLVFDKNITRFFKCDHPFKVNCGNRTELQPPQRTSEYCPRRNGVFNHLDKTVCDGFITCDEGKLIFDSFFTRFKL